MSTKGAHGPSYKEILMTNFLMVFHFTGDYPTDEAGGAAMSQAWGGWYGSLGESMVNPGGQARQASTVSASSTVDSSGQVSGFAIVSAPDHAAAVALAQTNPIVANDDGTVEVIEIAAMG